MFSLPPLFVAAVANSLGSFVGNCGCTGSPPVCAGLWPTASNTECMGGRPSVVVYTLEQGVSVDQLQQLWVSSLPPLFVATVAKSSGNFVGNCCCTGSPR